MKESPKQNVRIGVAMSTTKSIARQADVNTDTILSIAALFYGDFNIDWLQEVSSSKASQIITAMESGLQNKWLTGRDGYYRFTNAVQQQRLRERLPTDVKDTFRKLIVRLLMDESPQMEKARVVTPYLLDIQNDLTGCRFLIEGGTQYLRDFRYEDAGQCFEKAIEDLRNFEGEEADLLLINAVVRYSKVYTVDPISDRAISAIKEAIVRARKRGHKSSLVLLEMNMAKNEWLRSRHEAAIKHFENGLILVNEIEDPKVQRSAMIFSQFFYYWMGRYQEVIKSYESLVPEVEIFPKGAFPLLAAITVGACYVYTGQVTHGLGMLDAIKDHSLKNGNLFIAGHAEITMGHLLLEIQRPEEAIQWLEKGLEKTISSRNLYAYLGGLGSLSQAHYLLNNTTKAFQLFQEFTKLSHRAQMPMRHSPYFMDFCWAMEEGKLPRLEKLSLDKEIRLSMEGGNIFTKGIGYRYKAYLLRRKNAPGEDIIAALNKSITCLEESDHQIELAKSKLDLAREYLRLKDLNQSKHWAVPAAKVLYACNPNMVPGDIKHLIKELPSDQHLLEEILRLGQEIVTIRENRDLFNRIITTVNRITGAERGAIFILSEQEPCGVMLRAAKNLTPEDILRPEFSSTMKLIREVCDNGTGRIIDSDVPDDTPETSVIRSRIFMPMMIRGKAIGVLYHDNRLFKSAFRQSDLKVLKFFAGQAAIAMDNAQAWEALRQMYEQQQNEKQYYQEQYLKNGRFGDFVGKSPGIVRVFKQIDKVTDTDATVMIFGETGVGKELVARSIHRGSSRRDHPFIRVDCGALPESLICSELFGHEKGAFTGAASKRLGRFELANGGTLFLDEIGEISLEVQARLLRVLQTKEFERLGGNETHRSDFRLVAATNRELQNEVEKGRFRKDLYYRLNIFPIRVPPLRERKQDIPLLATYFLKLYANKFKKNLDTIPAKEMEKLVSYYWPGNVRELENVIERGVILSSGPYYRVPELGPSADRAGLGIPPVSLKENERCHILAVLKWTEGKIAGRGGAAEILQVHPNTLFSRMKKLGIERRPDSFTVSTAEDSDTRN